MRKRMEGGAGDSTDCKESEQDKNISNYGHTRFD